MHARPSTEGRVATPSGIRLYYRQLGRGPTIVVIPAATWWGEQADALADRMQVVLYDTRGRGRSDAVTDDTPLGIEHDLADIESLRRHFGLQRISLIGWSYFGAMVAMYAAAHGGTVDRVVQVGPLVPRKDPYFLHFIEDYSARAARHATALADTQQPSASRSREASEFRNALLARILPQLGDPSVAERIADVVGTDLPNEHPTTLGNRLQKSMATLGNWDFRPAAARVTAPVLIVHGMADNIPLASSMEWRSTFPNARLLTMGDVGHYPFYERPGEFFEAVGEFLAGGWPGAAER